PATALISTLSLHDALPICSPRHTRARLPPPPATPPAAVRLGPRRVRRAVPIPPWIRRACSSCGLRWRCHPARAAAFPHTQPVLRSEEHTSELQSRENLVCR